jgi:urease accessory protein
MMLLAVLAALLTAPTAALAHPAIPGIGGFTGGMLHPLLIPAHAMALVAVGLLIGRAPLRGLLAIAFTLALVGGLGALITGVGETAAANVLLVASAIAGVLLAIAVATPLVAAPLAIVIGAAVGLDSPPQEISVGLALRALAGTAIGAGGLVALIALCAARLHRPWQTIAVRVFGSWIAASAILVLALQLARL